MNTAITSRDWTSLPEVRPKDREACVAALAAEGIPFVCMPLPYGWAAISVPSEHVSLATRATVLAARRRKE